MMSEKREIVVVVFLTENFPIQISDKMSTFEEDDDDVVLLPPPADNRSGGRPFVNGSNKPSTDSGPRRSVPPPPVPSATTRTSTATRLFPPPTSSSSTTTAKTAKTPYVSEDESTFDVRVVKTLLLKGATASGRSLGADHVASLQRLPLEMQTAVAELLRSFVCEGVLRAKHLAMMGENDDDDDERRVSASSSMPRITAEHVARVLPGLLLDF